MSGIPKFLLPISETETLLHWHVARMAEVCDEVRVCTRSLFAPLVESLGLPVTLYIREPSTMSDAVAYMAGHSADDDFMIGMPDTIVLDSTANFYRAMRDAGDSDPAAGVIAAAFACTPELRGQVGQIELDANGLVLRSADKDPACPFPDMWGGLMLRRGVVTTLDRESPTPSLEFPRWLENGIRVRAARCAGRYVDIGHPSALASLQLGT